LRTGTLPIDRPPEWWTGYLRQRRQPVRNPLSFTGVSLDSVVPNAAFAREGCPVGASAPDVPTSTETPIEPRSVTRCEGNASNAGTGRVLERRRAVALARHYREFEGLSIRQIADRLGRSPATVKAYF